MITFANTTTTAAGGNITVTWITAPGASPYDDPPAGVPARTGPRPSGPPVLVASRTDDDDCWAVAVPA
jgi:hypothetical protein